MDKTLLTEAAPKPYCHDAVLDFKQAAGHKIVRIPYSAIQHSGLINNLIIDLGEDSINEPVELSSASLDKITDKGFDLFIKCWTTDYETIPDHMENASIYRYIDIPNDVAAQFKLEDGCWDVNLLADCIKLANFLDIPRLLEFFKLLLAKYFAEHI